MKRRRILTMAGTAAALAGAGVALRSRWDDAFEPLKIKFSHVVAPQTAKGRAAESFKRLVEERSGGRIEVEVYANSALYRDKEELEALQLGSVQMIAPSLAKLAPLGIRAFEVFDLPYLFDDADACRRVTDGAAGRLLLEQLSEVGVLGLAFWDNGFKLMSANRPLRRPQDCRGLRMRIQPSEVLDAQMRALGAVPDPMALSDVYSALASGVVDGTENPASNFYTQGMHAVQRYLTLSEHGYLGYVILVSASFWNGLAARTRALLEECLEETTRLQSEMARADNLGALERIRASGMTQIIELDDAERDAWRSALQGVRGRFEQRFGPELLQMIDAAIRSRPGAARH
jgi:C4-dicarboxylate-binding protein DctP